VAFSAGGDGGRKSPADANTPHSQEGGMIEFLAQMPTDTKIFLAMAVLALATMLVVLRRLI